MFPNISQFMKKLITRYHHIYINIIDFIATSSDLKNLNKVPLTKFINSIAMALDKPESCVDIFCKLPKTFDCISHDFLLK